MLKNIPDWIYEPLPYLYAMTGLVATFVLDAVVGKISGALLISAGIVVWNLRFTYRRMHQRPRKRDLSWGANQRMHPPEGLDDAKRSQHKATVAARQAAQEEEEDF